MNDRAYDTDLLDTLSKRVMVGDGAMGTQLQAADLTLDDFNNLEGCNEILNDTRPDVIETIHRNYFEAGADAVETNTFGCNLSNLGDYDIADRIRDLSQRGTAIARRVADEMSTPDRRRYVLGSMGPGTKLPTLGHTEYAVIRDAYTEAALGMLEGGADAILVETCQDLLQLKAAVLGSRRAMAQFGRHIPVIAHVTVETTGTMLLGSEIGAALTAVEPLGVDMIGLNCATGPAEMSEHLRYLSQHARTPVSVMPNAGLPVLGANGAEYPLQPDELAEALSGFVTDYGLSLVGGCCGTTPEHIRRVAEAVPSVQRAERHITFEPAVASLYASTPFAQDASVLMIGERTNANGSKAFREAMLAEDWQKCLDIAKEQTRDGAHLLDLCVDYVGRDGVADMNALASRLATASTLPIMLDSTETPVLKAGLEHLGGRCAINSVNYEDGDGPDSRFHKTMELVAEHGAAVVALTIDEEGQARTAEKKVEIAERLIDDITGNWGVDESSILIDCLTFTICTGQEESRKDGVETIEAIRKLKQRHPDVQTTLGTFQHLVRPESRCTTGAQLRVPARVPGSRPGFGDRARKQDPADEPHRRQAARGRSGPRLRPSPRGLRPAARTHGDVRGRVGGLVEGVARRGAGQVAAARAAGAAHRRRRTQRAGGRSRRGDDRRSRRWPSSTRTCWRA